MDINIKEKNFSELIGLPFDAQQRILKRARQKTHPWKHGLVGLSIAFAIGVIYRATIHRLIFPLDNSAEILSYGIIGAISGLVCVRYYMWSYQKAFQHIVRELIRDEKNHIDENNGFVSDK